MPSELTPDEIFANLSAQDWALYRVTQDEIQLPENQADPAICLPRYRDALESLARANRWIKKHEWVANPNVRYSFMCLECGHETCQTAHDLERALIAYPDEFIHAPNCAIAQLLSGVGAKESEEPK